MFQYCPACELLANAPIIPVPLDGVWGYQEFTDPSQECRVGYFLQFFCYKRRHIIGCQHSENYAKDGTITGDGRSKPRFVHHPCRITGNTEVSWDRVVTPVSPTIQKQWWLGVSCVAIIN